MLAAMEACRVNTRAVFVFFVAATLSSVSACLQSSCCIKRSRCLQCWCLEGKGGLKFVRELFLVIP